MITAVLHPTANAQSPDPQQKCATEAKIAFQDLRREYDAEARGLQLKVDVRLNDYRHYYNTKLERCLLVINKNTTMVDELSHTSYLIDTDRRMYAIYMETNRCNPAPLYKACGKRWLVKAVMNLTRLFRSTWENKNNDRQGL
jgi:hypothetical protein